jgi:hypothetical protein
MRIIGSICLTITIFLLLAGGALAECPQPVCSMVTGDPVPSLCSDDVCNTHVFFTDSEGRLAAIEHNIVDYGWPCPGRCPVWDEATRTYVREYIDYGWRWSQINSLIHQLDCDEKTQIDPARNDPTKGHCRAGSRKKC